MKQCCIRSLTYPSILQITSKSSTKHLYYTDVLPLHYMFIKCISPSWDNQYFIVMFLWTIDDKSQMNALLSEAAFVQCNVKWAEETKSWASGKQH